MSATLNEFLFKVVVRRVNTGAASPFGWELYRGDTIVPLHVSADRFQSMEAAYAAGRMKMADVASQRKIPPMRRNAS